MIIQVIVVLKRTVIDSDWHFNNLCSCHLQSQVSCITSVDGIKLWLVTLLVNQVAML